MKLQSFLLPALAGISATNAEEQLKDAEAYIIRQSKINQPNAPSIPTELARAILLQRLETLDRPSTLGRLPESLSEDVSIQYVNYFGKTPLPLFEDTDVNEPSQLVIALTGVTTDNHKDLEATIPGIQLAFTAPGLTRLPVSKGEQSKCGFEQAINPNHERCWKGKSQYLEYDVSKNSKVISQLGKHLDVLNTLALDNKMETTILFLASPSSESEELRRRELDEEEQVVVKDVEDVHLPTADSTFNSEPNPDKPFHAFASSSSPRPVIPSCFTSHNACISATDSCSGHGQCVDRWGKVDGDHDSCFFCYCMATNETDAEGRTGVYHWGGNACHKRDVSTPFWLFAGVSIALVATIAFSIGLLFSVGEEKLPGVIGAGVSRSK